MPCWMSALMHVSMRQGSEKAYQGLSLFPAQCSPVNVLIAAAASRYRRRIFQAAAFLC